MSCDADSACCQLGAWRLATGRAGDIKNQNPFAANLEKKIMRTIQ
jgi:hypothetical protein